jgi:4-aminobutyrate aminotransferase-like enzyme
VRGRGLFLGVELVRASTRASTRGGPATEAAAYVCNRLRTEAGILVGTEGPAHNTLKIRPPLCFSERDADFFAAALDAVLQEDGLAAAAAARWDW